MVVVDDANAAVDEAVAEAAAAAAASDAVDRAAVECFHGDKAEASRIPVLVASVTRTRKYRSPGH